MTEQAAADTFHPTMTDSEALDEAVLYLYRKAVRAMGDCGQAFQREVWTKMPEGAKRMIRDAERRADVRRSQGQLSGIKITDWWWPTEDEIDDEELTD